MVADYDFTNFYTPDTKWNQAGAKINYDMQKIFDLVYDGLGYVDTIMMAPDVANSMLEDKTYIKTFDGRNINMGELNAKYKGSGTSLYWMEQRWSRDVQCFRKFCR